MKKRVKRSYKRIPQANGIAFAKVVGQRIADDPQFVDMLPLGVQLKVVVGTYEVAASNASDGGKKLILIKNEAYTPVMEQLDDLADAVEVFAKGDDIILLAAGFELIAEPKGVNELPIPTGLEVSNNVDRTGVANVKWKSEKGVINTGLEYQKIGETAWKNGGFSSGSSGVLTGLEGGAYYNIRVYFIGRKGLQSDPSDFLTVLVS